MFEGFDCGWHTTNIPTGGDQTRYSSWGSSWTRSVRLTRTNIKTQQRTSHFLNYRQSFLFLFIWLGLIAHGPSPVTQLFRSCFRGIRIWFAFVGIFNVTPTLLFLPISHSPDTQSMCEKWSGHVWGRQHALPGGRIAEKGNPPPASSFAWRRVRSDRSSLSAALSSLETSQQLASTIILQFYRFS